MANKAKARCECGEIAVRYHCGDKVCLRCYALRDFTGGPTGNHTGSDAINDGTKITRKRKSKCPTN